MTEPIKKKMTIVVTRTTQVDLTSEQVEQILRDAVGAPPDARVNVGEYVHDAAVSWTTTESQQDG